MSGPAKPRILITNDDGINAPGIRALINELARQGFADLFVSAPDGERSAQSHAITLGRYMSCVPREDITGVVEAYAVDGTPADSVMLAMHSNIFKDNQFHLCVSGINRGDNCGLHVLYSGTVGAAREAACKGMASIALSLDNHLARREADYALSAQLSAALIKSALGLMPGQSKAPAAALSGHVISVNFPIAQGQMLQGFHLTTQSLACVFPAFKEVSEAPGPHLAEIDEHTPNARVFRNYAGLVQEDDTEGGDAWAVRKGWVSVTPLGLKADMLTRHSMDGRCESVLQATSEIITCAANEAGIGAGGITKL